MTETVLIAHHSHSDSPLSLQKVPSPSSHWRYINNGTSGRCVSVKWAFMRHLLLFVDPPRLTHTLVHSWKQSDGVVRLSRGNWTQAESVADSMTNPLPEKTNWVELMFFVSVLNKFEYNQSLHFASKAIAVMCLVSDYDSKLPSSSLKTVEQDLIFHRSALIIKSASVLHD